MYNNVCVVCMYNFICTVICMCVCVVAKTRKFSLYIKSCICTVVLIELCMSYGTNMTTKIEQTYRLDTSAAYVQYEACVHNT